MSEPTDSDRARAVRRVLPLVIIVVLLVAVGIAVVVGGGDDDDDGDSDGASASTTETDGGGEIGSADLPEGVLPFAVAEEEGIEVDWPDTCDVDRGTAAVPSFLAPACFAPFEGDNGGETASGVTEDSIKIVVFQTPDDDPVLSAIAALASDDTNPEVRDTLTEFLPYYETFYETYGRSVELEFYEGTGLSTDEVAARADAATIAEDLQPFMVWGAPTLAGVPFAEELAGQGIMNIQLASGGDPDFYVANDPYLFGIGISTLQSRQTLAEYIGKRLAGRPAEHAGDPDLLGQERVFGTVFLESGPESRVILDSFEDYLAEYDVTLEAEVPYADPVGLQTDAPSVIARLKEAGVTTVVFTGDPLAPKTLTEEATAQEYFPEWILTGSALVDTTVYARTYDQRQWAHAFGPSNLTARTDPEVAGSYVRYQWFTCSPPPADDSITLTLATPDLFYSVLQGVGPELTAENFRDVLFGAAPTPRAITNPSLSYGDRGLWFDPDYAGIDDATEIWWDPEAEGSDETRKEGAGMYRYVDGGTRYLPGEWPEEAPKVFDPERAVVLYDEPPADESYPDYPAPCS